GPPGRDLRRTGTTQPGIRRGLGPDRVVVSTTFRSAATAFADLVHAIPESAWDGTGLGDWDLRALVGHASRSLITVSTYLRAPADREDVTSPADYYAWVHEHLANA